MEYPDADGYPIVAGDFVYVVDLAKTRSVCPMTKQKWMNSWEPEMNKFVDQKTPFIVRDVPSDIGIHLDGTTFRFPWWCVRIGQFEPKERLIPLTEKEVDLGLII